MRRLTCAIALLPMALALQGCALVDLARFSSGQKVLTVEPNEITFCGIRANGLHFDVALRIENLSDGAARLHEIRLEALVDGAPAFSATRQERLLIAQKEKVTVHVPVVMDPLRAGSRLATGKRTLVFRGTVKADLGVLGERRFSFESEHKLFPGTRRRIRFEGVSLRKTSLRKLHLELKMRREDDRGDPYRSVSISGAVRVNGRKVGVIDFSRPRGLPEAFKIDVSVPVLTAAWMIRKVVKAEKMDLKVDLLFEAQTDTLKFRIPYVFEKKNIRIGSGKPAPPD